jgi:hypothetical protein
MKLCRNVGWNKQYWTGYFLKLQLLTEKMKKQKGSRAGLRARAGRAGALGRQTMENAIE